ncbi:hypothetical protein N9O62_03725 [Burkholderiaceae bacterium]|nr:hypothetical protein [Burkholderiaceae bacterium]
MILNPYAIVIDVYAALGGKQPGATSYADHKAYINANGQAAYLTALEGMFASQTNATMSATILGNLGLASVFTAAQGEAYLAANAGNRVKAALDLASALTNYVSDATNTNDAAILAAKTTYVATTANAYTYASNAANTADAATSSAAVSTGQTFTLTTSADTLTGTSGADTFGAIQSATATTETWSTADTIDGGDGIDTLNLTNEEGAVALLATVANIEVLNYRSTVAGAHIDLANMTSVDTVTMDRTIGATNLSGVALTDTVTLSKLAATAQTTVTYTAASVTSAADAATTTLDGLVNGSEVTFANDVETINLVTTGAASTLDSLVLDAQTTTLTIAADEALTIDDVFTTAGVTTLTVTGDSLVTITPTLVDATTTINASGMTGGGLQVLVGNATATVQGGAGDDIIAFAVGELTSVDTVTGGDGDDTLSIMDETINAALYAEINASTGFEKFQMAATGAGTDMAVAMSSLTGIDAIKFSGLAPVGTAGAADGTNAGTVTIAITAAENADSYEFFGDVTGGVGGAITDASNNDAGAGAAAVTIANLIDGGTNTFTMTMLGGVAITGGAGGAMDNDATTNNASGNGGAGVSAGTIETLTITSSGTTANSIAGGAAGATPDAGDTDGTAGSSVIVNTNGVINVNGAQNLNLGTIAGTNASVNASTFTGQLTVVGEAGNNVIIGGSAVDTITGGDGQDTLTGGAGTDIFIFATDLDAELATAAATDANSITDYVADILRLSDTAGNDVYSVAGTATGAVATSNVAIDANGLVTFAAADDTLAEKIVAIAADADIANNEVAIFNHGSDTYVYGASDTTAAGDDFLIKLTGVTLTSITEQATSGDFVVTG